MISRGMSAHRERGLVLTAVPVSVWGVVAFLVGIAFAAGEWALLTWIGSQL